MEYGILVVEDGSELYQILGSVHTIEEAREMAEDYELACGPDSPDCNVPPTEYVIIRRNDNGRYTKREIISLS